MSCFLSAGGALSRRRHGHHHVHQDDHAGHPEPVWLRGGGEPGCSQSPPGPIQGGGRTQRRTSTCTCPNRRSHGPVCFCGVLTVSCRSVCGQNGQTPLMLAAEQGSLEIVQELIRRGANVNLDDVVSLCVLVPRRPRLLGDRPFSGRFPW